MEYLIGLVVSYLNIKKPYTIRILSEDNEYCAEYTAWYKDGYDETPTNLLEHGVDIYFNTLDIIDERSLETLIAHEFIHAWQAENGITDLHGERFQSIAKDMEEFLINSGVTNIRYIYKERIDL